MQIIQIPLEAIASYQAFNDSKSPLLRALTGQMWTMRPGEAAAYNWNG